MMVLAPRANGSGRKSEETTSDPDASDGGINRRTVSNDLVDHGWHHDALTLPAPPCARDPETGVGLLHGRVVALCGRYARIAAADGSCMHALPVLEASEKEIILACGRSTDVCAYIHAYLVSSRWIRSIIASSTSYIHTYHEGR